MSVKTRRAREEDALIVAVAINYCALCTFRTIDFVVEDTLRRKSRLRAEGDKNHGNDSPPEAATPNFVMQIAQAVNMYTKYE